METCTRTLHTHALQIEVTPEFREDAAIELDDLLKTNALYEIRRTNPDAEVVEQVVRRWDNDPGNIEAFMRDLNPGGRETWQVRTRFSTALPVVYPEI